MKEKVVSIIIIILLYSCTTEQHEKAEQKPQDKRELVLETLPKTLGEFEKSLIYQDLVNIQEVDSSILVDLKYSTEDNFFGRDVYEELTNAYLPLDVAIDLKKASTILIDKHPDLRLLVFDAVRPHRIQEILWEALDSIPANVRKAYVADPSEGSLHNYGCAVDLSIYDLRKDSLLDMGTKYDYFGYLAYPRMESQMLASGELSQGQIENRDLLRDVMLQAGFKPITSEWWHFNRTSLAQAKLRYELIK